MSNSHKNFIPLSGYKDVFYNPNCQITSNSPCKTPSNSPTANKSPIRTIKTASPKNYSRKSFLSKRNISVNNLRIDVNTTKDNVQLQDWTNSQNSQNSQKNVKAVTAKDPDIFNSPFSTLNPLIPVKELLLNKQKLNLTQNLFIFSSPDKKTENNDFNYDIYDKIKQKIINIINNQNNDKKIVLVNKLIELIKDTELDEKKLCIFLENL